MKKTLWLFVLWLLTQLPLLAQTSRTSKFVSDSLEQYINQGMAKWKIPGLAVAIVKDGKIILSKGYGVKEIGKESPVDETTLFMIASNTKEFTGTALALLEQQKKLSLDDQVRKFLPTFSLYDTLTSQLVTIRDILSHRLGTKNYQGDFLFWDTDLSRVIY
ncbi:serine hydrolase domain-containing protein [Spirosoma telluris]|uniref:serine hydrolase domain-containing protein n=1 Tax=Spirosoma telluris TaxID=2183553 RepID=UPI002FC3CC19